ncbi:TIR domain-containing protein [Haloferula helveola]|uniref:TIR domain-containing protein n=1 Tax=Haloferula helveola TaxID=490095 RepID=A0ABN6H8K3_9BACT|nr:TIR domain-containing protein [Haloferula helveola]
MVATAGAAIVLLTALGFYTISLQICNLTFEYAGSQRTQFVPLIPNAELRTALDGQSLKEFASKYGPDEVRLLVSDQALAWTRYTLLLGYALVSTALALTVWIPTFWLAGSRNHSTRSDTTRKLLANATSDPSGESGSGVFISYRRTDSAFVTDRIYDSLIPLFGSTRVFKDVDSIALGDDFQSAISEAVGSCQVLVAIIGDEWLTTSNADGTRRLDQPDDFVRIEIETALQRNIPVIPVLLDGTSMPRADELPEPMRALSTRNAARIRPAPDFENDIERLTNRFSQVIGTTDF